MPAFIVLMLSLLCYSLGFAASSTRSEALHLDWIDNKIDPGDDFFNYANGNWLKKNPIPSAYASWGVFYVLQEKNQKLIRELLLSASKDKEAKPDSILQKIGDFYYSGMDEALINKTGLQPLQAEFDSIQAIKNIKDLQRVITHLQSIGVNALFNFSSMQDFIDSKKMIGAISQGGLGLPDRDYYLEKNSKFEKIRQAYRQHIAKMLELIGTKPEEAQTAAKSILSLETILAKASLSQTAQREPQAIYHMMDLNDLEKRYPQFAWKRYFSDFAQPELKQINVAMPIFFKTVNEQLANQPLATWKNYLRWQLISSFAPYLSTAFVEENFHMTSILSGKKTLLPRWQRVINTENEVLGFAIGKLYVERYFPPAAKEQVLDILHTIRETLQHDLQTLTWMTTLTRQAALEKLALIEERVGYPDKWWDYSNLKVDRSPYVVNIIRGNRFLIKRDLSKIAKPIDHSEWAMTPQTINAYYDPSMNNINLPAGILQPPFFDPAAPAALNYGAIGFVIGHEITHGFDDQGAKFDGQGNLKNWWTTEDLQKFTAATACIAQQFSRYKIEDWPVQGQLVVGEASADLGGLTLAYRAFLRSKAYKEAQTIEGFTPQQQFFLGSAHVWAGLVRPEQARHLLMVDPHPPLKYRVNGTLANMPAFQTAFNIPPSSPMVNTTPCTIW